MQNDWNDTFIAAIGSTTVTMEWAMAELMRNPPVIKKAKEEVRKAVGNKGKVEEVDLAQMNYLRRVIKEIKGKSQVLRYERVLRNCCPEEISSSFGSEEYFVRIYNWLQDAGISICTIRGFLQ
ncbi:hypothetical protein ACLOJK_038166 [Asimina triloba]